MPTPYEIAEQIRNDIKVKLRLGFYKLKMLQMRDGTSRKLNSRVRKLFALVIKEDGTVFDGFIGCSKCFKVFKSSITVPSSGVYNHVNKCPKNQIKDEIVAEEEKNAKKSNSIWKSFTLALKPDGVAGLYCEQCKMILEPSMESHECLNDDKTNHIRVLFSRRELQNRIKIAIAAKLKSDLYRLKKNTANLEPIWNMMDLIETTNGCTISNYVCCSTCKSLLQNFRHNLLIHKCYTNSLGKDNRKLSDDEKNLENKKPSGTMLREKSNNGELQKTGSDNIESTSSVAIDVTEVELDNKTSQALREETYKLQIPTANSKDLQETKSDTIESKSYVVTDNSMDTDKSLEIQKAPKQKIPTDINKDLEKTKSDTTGSMTSKTKDDTNNIELDKNAAVDKTLEIKKTSRKSNAATYKQKVLIANRIFDGLYKLVKNTEGKSPIWNVYSWIMEPDGTIIKDYIYCTKCLSVLKYDDDSRHVSNVKRHACAQKYWHEKPQETKTPDDSVNKFREQQRTPEKETIIMATTSNDKDNSDEVRRVEISTNIYQGVYKLIMVKNRKSLVWKLFAMITKANGTLVKGYVYCTICSRLLAFDGRRTGSLKNHKCAKKHWKHLLMEAEETEGTTTKSRPMTTKQHSRKCGLSIKRLKTDENEIDDDSISLSDDCDNLQSYNEDLCVVNEAEDDEDDLLSYNNDQIGLKFEHISTDNGSILDGVVRCCHCKMELEYKGSYKIQLNEHECVNETVLPIKMEFDEEIKSTGLECTTIKQEANDNLYRVKEEDEGEVNSTKSPIYLEEQYDSKEKLYLNTYETKSQAHDDTPYHYVIHELDESNNTYIKEEFKDF